MAALTTAQEYASVREAIQLLSTGRAAATVSVGGMSITYIANQLVELERREETLAKRLTCRNVRKRVTPDFSEGDSYIDL